MNRKEFLQASGLIGGSLLLLNGCNFFSKEEGRELGSISVGTPKKQEDIFAYINRIHGEFEQDKYRKILGTANEFKEGDDTIHVAASSDQSRANARILLANTRIGDLEKHVIYDDDILQLIQKTTPQHQELSNWTFNDLKEFLLNNSESEIKTIMPSLSSDVIACSVKLMNNEELIRVSQKVFNPLPGSKIGSKGYMGARVQPNSPTDNPEDISWQVFDAWSYAVGDVVLGTNPVSSEVESVAAIENTLYDIISTFHLEETIPNCVLSHVDVQAEVEQLHPGKTGVWFQSIAGTVGANQTFDLTIDKMMKHASTRNGQFGFYAETGQGADLTNGHANGFDMVIHESRKYGFLRALKYKINEEIGSNDSWVHVNDVAGFIGPEVFKNKEQLVRCCLEDTVMGKLHGLTIGLDICSTLHMDVTLEDLDWCIHQVMPANPAYLMALPTKNDPMLSYLTTAFNNHVEVREKFNYKVNDEMWDFFKELEVIDSEGRPTEHFGDPIWVYAKYREAKSDSRSLQELYSEGKEIIQRIEGRGVPIAQGYGENIWDLKPELEAEVNRLYEDAKESLWTEVNSSFVQTIPSSVGLVTQSKDRKDYVYHPESGESLSEKSIQSLKEIRSNWGIKTPKIQLVISDGLNSRALMDEGHLSPFLAFLSQELQAAGLNLGEQNLFIQHGRVRAGYACGEYLFGKESNSPEAHGIIHIIGERPGSGHHNFSAYLTVAKSSTWNQKGKVDHNLSRVVSGISDTSLVPEEASKLTVKIMAELFEEMSRQLQTT